MNLLCRCIIPSILASLGLMAIPATALAQLTSGEPNLHFVDKSSRADAESLQKKPFKPRPGSTPIRKTAIK